MIPMEEVQRVAPLARPHIEHGVDRLRGKIGVDDMLFCCVRDEMQLWLIYDPAQDNVVAVLVTELVVWPKRKGCRIVFVGGTGLGLVSVESLLLRVEKWALFQKCDHIIIEGRAGWARMLPGSYAETARVFERNL